jgi:hypothetical protein
MGRWNSIALGILATSVVALAAFPYYSEGVARLVVRQPGPAPAVASGGLVNRGFPCSRYGLSSLRGRTFAGVQFA